MKSTKIINIIDSDGGAVITTVRVPSNVRSEQVLQALRRQNLDPRDECLTKFKIGEIFGKEVKNVENIFF